MHQVKCFSFLNGTKVESMTKSIACIFIEFTVLVYKMEKNEMASSTICQCELLV